MKKAVRDQKFSLSFLHLLAFCHIFFSCLEYEKNGRETTKVFLCIRKTRLSEKKVKSSRRPRHVCHAAVLCVKWTMKMSHTNFRATFVVFRHSRLEQWWNDLIRLLNQQVRNDRFNWNTAQCRKVRDDLWSNLTKNEIREISLGSFMTHDIYAITTILTVTDKMRGVDLWIWNTFPY